MEKMDAKMGKLDKIEESTTSLSSQILTIAQKTSEIETQVEANTTKAETNANEIHGLKAEVSSLRELVEKQGRTIEGLTKIEEKIVKNNKRTVAEMNDLISQQKEQVDTLQATTKRMKSDIKSDIKSNFLHRLDDNSKRIKADVKSDMRQEINDKMKDNSKRIKDAKSDMRQEISHKDLKERAFRNRFNLVFTGIQEDPDKSAKKSVDDFLKSNLKIKDVDILSAYRIGSPPAMNSKYNRPIIATFSQLPHRNKVWRKRMNIPAENGSTTVHIHADLPKQLREDVRALYRVAKAASSIPEFQSATIRDYALDLDGQEYLPRELESLPVPIRPSTLATRSSNEALVFFSRHSVMSNHHPSKFILQGTTFYTVEQFLAYKRAWLADHQPSIQKALNAKDPTEAKAILNSLKDDHPQEWENTRASWAMEAIHAKFAQNQDLAAALCKTKGKYLGEASRDTVWGIGMDLDDPDVLDLGKWSATGNLLGKTIMSVREEILSMRQTKKN